MDWNHDGKIDYKDLAQDMYIYSQLEHKSKNAEDSIDNQISNIEQKSEGIIISWKWVPVIIISLLIIDFLLFILVF